MALSEGLKGFVNLLTQGFKAEDDDAFADLVGDGGDYDTDGTLALDTMYGTKTTPTKPERSFDRESKVVSHPNSYKSGEVTVIEPRSFSESAQIVRKLLDRNRYSSFRFVRQRTVSKNNRFCLRCCTRY